MLNATFVPEFLTKSFFSKQWGFHEADMFKSGSILIYQNSELNNYTQIGGLVPW
jgi:hypothetical protein